MRGMCAAMLTFEAILLALSTPVMIAVEDVDKGLALTLGIGLSLLAIITAGSLRRPGAYWVGHGIQVASIGLGFLVPAMFFVGGLFAVLWIAAVVLGRRIEADRARWAAEAEAARDEGPNAGPAVPA